MNQFYIILQEALKEKGITQTAAAQLTGIERKTFNSYYIGRTEPDLETLKKIVKVLEIEKEIVMFMTEQNVPRETSDRAKQKIIFDAGLYVELLKERLDEKEARRQETADSLAKAHSDKDIIMAELSALRKLYERQIETMSINLDRGQKNSEEQLKILSTSLGDVQAVLKGANDAVQPSLPISGSGTKDAERQVDGGKKDKDH